MAVDDLWYHSKRGANGERVESKRHGRGKRYRVRYIDDTGTPRERLFEKKADAEHFDVNTRADVSRGVYIDPSAGRTTVAALGAQWRETALHRGSTAERVARAFALHIDPVLGNRQAAQVRPSHIQAWVRDRSAVLAPSTLRVVYSYLASMFTMAVRDRVIGRTPCEGIRLPEPERDDRFIPSPEQVHALAAVLPARYSALVYPAAGCGLRQGEAFGLELEHVDFLRREIRVVQQLVTVAGRKPYLGPVKTPTSRRTVEMGVVVAERLARHVELFPPVEVELDDETDPRKPVRRTARLIFVNGSGDPIHRASWSHAWAPGVEAAGLPKGFGYHGLRHYFATLLIHAGASVKTVQLALGHSKPSITLDTYSHEWPDAVDRTRNLVDAALGAGPVRLASVG